MSEKVKKSVFLGVAKSLARGFRAGPEYTAKELAKGYKRGFFNVYSMSLAGLSGFPVLIAKGDCKGLF